MLTIPKQEILNLLSQYFGGVVEALEPIATGQISEPYSFTVDGEDYVIRFARPGLEETLYKDRYVSTELLRGVPVAEFVHMDEYQDRTYAITRKAAGKILDEFQPDEYELLIPDLMSVLDRTHWTVLNATTGWGDFDRAGVGRSKDLKSYLASIEQNQSQNDGGFYGNWHPLFDDSFLERDLFYEGFEVMKSKFDVIPNHRNLVHMDYAFDNVLAEGTRVTAVIDWANAVFGDFMMDVARLEFHMPQWQWAARFEAYYQEQNRPVPHFNERLICYSCFEGLGGMRYSAKTDQRAAYDKTANRLRSLIAAS